MQEINEQFHEELKKMHRKITCVDCNSPHAHWATLRRGFFICTRCAKKKLIRQKEYLICNKNDRLFKGVVYHFFCKIFKISARFFPISKGSFCIVFPLILCFIAPSTVIPFEKSSADPCAFLI